MPWRETKPMKERILFIADLESCLYTMSELCQRYGVSRKTGYKWAERYLEGGLEELRDRPRVAQNYPHRTEARVVAALEQARCKRPSWGPRKLLAYLRKRHPDWSWPAVSTAGDILRRAGLVKPRSRRSRAPHPGRPKLEAEAANDLWSMDFKGQFRTGDRRYCYPLTVMDRYSRYLLECKGLASTEVAGAQPVIERVFRTFGLPEAIVTDNGSPFSSPALCGLSRLSVWWIKLGIRPLLIEPAHPEQNGGHERMHRTLKEETTRPPAGNLASQQRRFESFQWCFNDERPHEALADQCPGELYAPSLRSYPERVEEMSYPGHYEVRRVRRNGSIRWQGEELFLSQVLSGELLGLEESADGVWSLWFGPLLLGRFDERERQLKA